MNNSRRLALRALLEQINKTHSKSIQNYYALQKIFDVNNLRINYR